MTIVTTCGRCDCPDRFSTPTRRSIPPCPCGRDRSGAGRPRSDPPPLRVGRVAADTSCSPRPFLADDRSHRRVGLQHRRIDRHSLGVDQFRSGRSSSTRHSMTSSWRDGFPFRRAEDGELGKEAEGRIERGGGARAGGDRPSAVGGGGQDAARGSCSWRTPGVSSISWFVDLVPTPPSETEKQGT